MSENLSWEDPLEAFDLPDWEPWEPDEDDDPRPAGLCGYCDSTEVREMPEPFGGQPCCEVCFARLIGDESDDPEPFRCGVALLCLADDDDFEAVCYEELGHDGPHVWTTLVRHQGQCRFCGAPHPDGACNTASAPPASTSRGGAALDA